MQQNQAEPELDLDGSTGVLLAPVPGPETRRDLGPEYFQKRPAVFVAKFAVAVAGHRRGLALGRPADHRAVGGGHHRHQRR